MINKFFAVFCLLTVSVTGSRAEIQSTRILATEEGIRIVRESKPGEFSRPEPLPFPYDNLIWERHQDVYIYRTCGMDGEGYFGGADNLAPALVEKMDGAGNLLWTHGGPSYQAWVHRGAVLEANLSNNGISFHGGPPPPTGWDWSTDIADIMTYNWPFRQTRDGTRFVAALIDNPGNMNIRTFDGSDGTEISSWDAGGSYGHRDLVLSGDGDLAVVRIGSGLFVINTSSGTLTAQLSTSVSGEALALSPDGRWLISGYEELTVWERSGNDYLLKWSETPMEATGFVLGSCGVNSEGDIVASWYKGDSFDQVKVQMVNAEVGGEGIWYIGPQSLSDYQNYPKRTLFDDECDLAVIAGWGDDGGDVPEVLVFQYGNTIPLLEMQTTGSMFATDTRALSSDLTEIVISGKAVHANEFGAGGDYYCLQVYSDTTGISAEQTEDLPVLLKAVSPNPFDLYTTISFSLARQQLTRVCIYDMSGALVEVITEGVYSQGEHSIHWDGLDVRGGEVASGVYLISLEAEDHSQAGKVILLR